MKRIQIGLVREMVIYKCTILKCSWLQVEPLFTIHIQLTYCYMGNIYTMQLLSEVWLSSLHIFGTSSLWHSLSLPLSLSLNFFHTRTHTWTKETIVSFPPFAVNPSHGTPLVWHRPTELRLTTKLLPLLKTLYGNHSA